jgi:hypothetical protein
MAETALTSKALLKLNTSTAFLDVTIQPEITSCSGSAFSLAILDRKRQSHTDRPSVRRFRLEN